MKYLDLVLLAMISLPLAISHPSAFAETEFRQTRKVDVDDVEPKPLKGWESILLDPFTVESSIEFTNDVSKVKHAGTLNKHRTASELHKFSLNYEITVADFAHGIKYFGMELPNGKNEKEKQEEIARLNKDGVRTFLNSIVLRAGGNWSNTASNIHEATGTNVTLNNQFTGSVNLTFKSCLYDLVKKGIIGCAQRK